MLFVYKYSSFSIVFDIKLNHNNRYFLSFQSLLNSFYLNKIIYFQKAKLLIYEISLYRDFFNLNKKPIS